MAYGSSRPRLPHFLGTYRIDNSEQIPKKDGSGHWLKVYVTDMASGLADEMSSWNDDLAYTLAMFGQVHDIDFSYNAEKGFKNISQLAPATNPPQPVRQISVGDAAPPAAPPMQQTMNSPAVAAPGYPVPNTAGLPVTPPAITPPPVSGNEGMKRGNALNVAGLVVAALINKEYLNPGMTPEECLTTIGWATLQTKRVASNIYNADPSVGEPVSHQDDDIPF